MQDSQVEGNRGEGSCPLAKAQVVIVFLVLFCVSHALVWGSRWLGNAYEWGSIALLLGATATMIMGPFLASRWAPRGVRLEITWIRRGSRSWYAILMVMVSIVWAVVAAIIAVHFNLHAVAKEVVRLPPSPTLVVIGFALSIVLGPIAEEIFWRGYAQDQFQRLLGGPLAVFLQAGAFAAAHLGSAWATVVTFGYGVIWGLWRQRMRSLFPLIVAHIAINALALGMPGYKAYREAVQWKSLDETLTAMGLPSLVSGFQKGRDDPKGREIDTLATKPQDEAIPGIIKFLGDANEHVRDYASLILTLKYTDRPYSYYEKALDSGNPRVIEGVIGIIWQKKWPQFCPKIHRLVMSVPDRRVQISGVMALAECGDVEALKDIAENHPDDIVRRSASRSLNALARKQESAQ